MAGYTIKRTEANTAGKAITATERTYEILRRVSFVRNCPVKALLEELTETLVTEAKIAKKAMLPEPSYVHEID